MNKQSCYCCYLQADKNETMLDMSATLLSQMMRLLTQVAGAQQIETTVWKPPASHVIPARWVGLLGNPLRTESSRQASRGGGEPPAQSHSNRHGESKYLVEQSFKEMLKQDHALLLMVRDVTHPSWCSVFITA